MARKRMIDPNIWDSADFGKLSNLAKIVFIGLFSLADDEGRGNANSLYLRSHIFPYNEKMRSTDIEVALSEISRNMSIVFYSYDGSDYYNLLNWHTFQKIDKPTPSRITPFDSNNKDIRLLFDEGSTSARREVAPNRIEENRIEENIEKKIYGEFKHVLLTDEELEKIKDYFWKDYKDRIRNLDEYLEDNPKKHYENHYLTMRKWARKEGYIRPDKPKDEKEKAKELLKQGKLTKEEYNLIVEEV